jgi:nucleoside-diphosphate-sugar epimerase
LGPKASRQQSGNVTLARRAFILGGTGQIGRAVARNLLDQGWRVVVAHRGRRPPPPESVEGGAGVSILDREQPGDLAHALADGADALIDTVAFTQLHADQLLEVQGNVGAFVVISSASVYRDGAGRTLDEAAQNGFPEMPDPIPESQLTVDPGPTTYSTRKVALERRLLDGAKVPVTVLRPCAIHGIGSQHPREWWLVKRMLDGRRNIPLMYRGSSRFHTSAVANIAALVHTAVKVPGKRVLNIGDPDAPSVAQIANLIARHLRYEGTLVNGSDSGNPPMIGDTPWSVPRPFVIDTRAALDLGYIPATAYADAVPAMCEWLVKTARGRDWREQFPSYSRYGDPFDYAAEDRFLSNQQPLSAL